MESIIYLSKVLCLSVCDSVCVSQLVSERSAILYVLVIKLTKETRECISTDQPDEDQCSEHQRSADQRLSTSTKIC
jgi:hypothetical protein